MNVVTVIHHTHIELKDRMMKVFHCAVFICLLALFFFTTDVTAQQRKRGENSGGINRLEDRIRKLEEKIEKLEKTRISEESDSELEMLLKEVETLSADKDDNKIAASTVFKGEERQQQQLNPEISMTGDFFGSYSSSSDGRIESAGDFTDGRNQMYLREAELSVMAPLDPFTRGKFFFGIPSSASTAPLSTIIEEAYLEWLNLPGSLNLKVGEFNTQFGDLNRWHDHSLPQVDRPRALVNLFGTGNFGGIGVAGNFLLPSMTAHVNELDVSVTSGGDGVSFDDSYRNLVGVARYKNYFDISRNTYFELGTSLAHGYNDEAAGHKTTLGGLDMTVKWVPAGRSHYRTTEIKTEVFFSHRETAGKDIDRFSMYSFIHNKMGARLWGGLRYSYSELPLLPTEEYEWDISPSLDFWQSEFVMLRLQYSYTERSYMENDHSVFIQSVWSMGPHKHAAY